MVTVMQMKMRLMMFITACVVEWHLPIINSTLISTHANKVYSLHESEDRRFYIALTPQWCLQDGGRNAAEDEGYDVQKSMCYYIGLDKSHTSSMLSAKWH